MARQIWGLTSAISTRARDSRLRTPRNPREDGCALARCGGNIHFTAHRADARLHVRQSMTDGFAHPVEIEALAVVADLGGGKLTGGSEFDAYLASYSQTGSYRWSRHYGGPNSDEAIAQRCRMIRNHGMQRRYYHDMLGFNFRMSDLHAAIGLGQHGDRAMAPLMQHPQRRCRKSR